MTSSKRDYIYNSGFDVWAFVFNLFNANKAMSLCMCTRTRALKEETQTFNAEGLVFCYYKLSCCGYAIISVDVDHVRIRDRTKHQTAAT